jgi:aryl-alcohol dehydrogenase-like predicted oxidoreductase
MRFKQFGRTGLQVSEVGFGAWAIGSEHYGPVAEADAADAITAYINAGGNFIDTARGYARSEPIIGKTLQALKARDRVVLCSKIWPNTAAEIEAACNESLKQLQTDHIDLMYLHNPPDSVDEMNQVLDVYDRLKAAGKIRFIGASIKGPDVTGKTVDLCQQYIASGRVDALQVIFSMLRQRNREMMADATRAGVAVVARTVLESGLLSGKYRRGHQFPPGFPKGDHRSRCNGPKLDSILTAVRDLESSVVAPPFTSVQQVAIRYALDEPGVTVAIPGAKTRTQVEANIAVASLPPLGEVSVMQINETFRGRESLVNLN